MHGLVLTATPFVSFEVGAPAERSVQVSFASSSPASERAIREAFAGVSQLVQEERTSHEAIDSGAPDLMEPMKEPRLARDSAELTSLSEELEADQQTLSRIELLATLVLPDRPEPLPVKAFYSASLTQPVTLGSSLRAGLNIEANLDAAAPVIDSSSPAEIPIPRQRPAAGSGIARLQKMATDETLSGDSGPANEVASPASEVDLSLLVGLLQKEIARNQQYPRMAWRKNREGHGTSRFRAASRW